MREVVEEQKVVPTGKIIGCGCTAVFLAVVAIVVAVVVGFFGLFKNTQAYRDSVSAINDTPPAVEALGEPVEPGFFTTGNISTNADGSGIVKLKIPVSGPKAKGTVFVEGTKTGGIWSYQVWELRVDGIPEPIPLGK